MSDFKSRVAVVDDDLDVLHSMRFLLEVAGHGVATFVCASDFLAEAGTGLFDSVILDQHMPRMSGLELATALRAKGVDLPIMLISGSLTPDIIARGRELGLSSVVEKPVAEADLMNFIDPPP